jgi:hypothetical protein
MRALPGRPPRRTPSQIIAVAFIGVIASCEPADVYAAEDCGFASAWTGGPDDQRRSTDGD